MPNLVYLCGAINGCSDSVAMGWRERVKADPALLSLGVEFLDPMRRDYRGREAESVRAIINGDEADIRACGVVLAVCDTPSWGTAMEIRLAHRELGKPVVVVCANPWPSPWLVGHCRCLRATLAEGVVAVADLCAGGVPR